VSKVKVGRSCL